LDNISQFCYRKWILWRDNPIEYVKYLKQLNNDLNLKENFYSYAPICFQGDWDHTREKILICSLNPGSGTGNSKLHQFEQKTRRFKASIKERKRMTWEKQELFMKKFFTNLSENSISSGFFTTLGYIVVKAYELKFKDKQDLYRILQNYLLNIDIIPFYSKSFKLGKLLRIDVLESFWERLERFIQFSDCKTFLLNGKSNYELFVQKGLLENLDESIDIKTQSGRSKVLKVRLGNKYGILSPHISRITEREPLIASLKDLEQI